MVRAVFFRSDHPPPLVYRVHGVKKTIFFFYIVSQTFQITRVEKNHAFRNPLIFIRFTTHILHNITTHIY